MQNYTFDTLGRLATAAEGSTWSRSFGADQWGNAWVSANSGVTLASFTPVGSSNFDSNNRLQIQGSNYDLAGNQTVIGGYAFAYDGENRLAQSTLGGASASYSYDGEGRRVKKVNGSRTVVYVYGVGGNLIQEYDTAAPAETGRQYLAQDMLGSTRVVFNSAGTAVRCMDYLPFGEQIPQGVGSGRSGACWAASDEPRQKFTGKEREGADGAYLDFFEARYFSAAQGRFTSPDAPVVYAKPENPQSWNLYSYGRNNPYKYVDPDGHEDVAAVGCGEDAECLKKLGEQRGRSVELISGAAKSVANSFITLSNSVNTVVDSAIAPFTDFRFGQTELLPTTTTEQVGGVLADVGILALTAGGSAPTAAKSTMSLFRAVGSAELAQIEKTGTFMNIAGNEVKYFSTTLEGAQSYAKQAARAFGDGPYSIVGSGIPTSAVRPDMLVTVDRGIRTVVVPTKVLPQLVKPRVIR